MNSAYKNINKIVPFFARQCSTRFLKPIEIHALYTIPVMYSVPK